MQQAADTFGGPVNVAVAQVVYAVNFSHWKRTIVRDFFAGAEVVFVDRPEQAPADCVLVVWGSKPLPDCVGEGVRLLRLEDGFLRSVGLGADLIRPISWFAEHEGHLLRLDPPVRPRTSVGDDELSGGSGRAGVPVASAHCGDRDDQVQRRRCALDRTG